MSIESENVDSSVVGKRSNNLGLAGQKGNDFSFKLMDFFYSSLDSSRAGGEESGKTVTASFIAASSKRNVKLRN